MALSEGFPSVLAAARSGAEWAWTSIYRELSPAVLRYLRARGAPDAEDLTGDVFVQMVRKLDSFEGGEPELRAWAMTIAHHRFIDELRKRSRRHVELSASDTLEGLCPAGDAEADALEAMVPDWVGSALASLTSDQRDVVFLRVIAGLSVAEVARAMDKSPGAVKALQFRALSAIRRRVEEGAVTSWGRETLTKVT